MTVQGRTLSLRLVEGRALAKAIGEELTTTLQPHGELWMGSKVERRFPLGGAKVDYHIFWSRDKLAQ